MLEFRDLLIIALIIYWIGRFFSNCYTKAKDNTKDKQIKTLKAEYDKRLKQLSDKYDNSISILTAERDNALKELDKHATNISLLISSNITSMPWLAGMMADYLTYDLEIESTLR